MIHKLYFVLWFTEPGFDILLLFVLFARRRAATFPFFTLCTVTDAAMYIVLTCAGYRRDSLFYKLLWPLQFAQFGVCLLLAFELYRHVFCRTGVWASDVQKPLIRIACIGTLVAFAIAFLAHPSVGPHSTLMWRIKLFNCILATIFYVGMLVLSSVAGLPWKTHAARIAQANCAGALLALTIQIIDNSVTLARLKQIYLPLMCFEMFMDAVFMVYWLVTLWRDEPSPQRLPEHRRKQIYSLQQQAENDLIRIRSWRSN